MAWYLVKEINLPLPLSYCATNFDDDDDDSDMQYCLWKSNGLFEVGFILLPFRLNILKIILCNYFNVCSFLWPKKHYVRNFT
jgi:hypothetical protein